MCISSNFKGFKYEEISMIINVHVACVRSIPYSRAFEQVLSLYESSR